jgi:tRNA G18 (ribose-2'-O)-methylase SpoU
VVTIVPVVSLDDPAVTTLLPDYRELRDVALRTRHEAEHGVFVAEGEKVIRRALLAGYRVRSLLMAPRWLDALRDVLADVDAPCLLAEPAVVEDVSGFHVHRGALAVLERRPLPAVEDVLRGSARVLVLEDVNDHTNVGAVFRNAAAFGFDAVLLSPRCADPLYRRSVKVAMGAVFAVPWTRLEDWYGAPDLLAGLGFETWALTPAGDADLRAIAPPDRVALLLGSEGHGLSTRWLAAADRKVRIPMAPGVDSLNVAAASAVVCYALSAAARDEA